MVILNILLQPLLVRLPQLQIFLMINIIRLKTVLRIQEGLPEWTQRNRLSMLTIRNHTLHLHRDTLHRHLLDTLPLLPATLHRHLLVTLLLHLPRHRHKHHKDTHNSSNTSNSHTNSTNNQCIPNTKVFVDMIG